MIEISTLEKEGIYSASKWIFFPGLLDPVELEDLFNFLGQLFFFNVMAKVLPQDATFSKEQVVVHYKRYVEQLKQGICEPSKEMRAALSSVAVPSMQAVYALAFSDGKLLVRQKEPAIQLQLHAFRYSDLDRQVHPMVWGGDSIPFGVQLSFPKLFRDPKTQEVIDYKEESYPNRALFQGLTSWMRANSFPATFKIGGNRVVSTVRVGKKALAWVNRLPILKQVGMEVVIHGTG